MSNYSSYISEISDTSSWYTKNTIDIETVNRDTSSSNVVINGDLILNGTNVSQALEDTAKVLGIIKRDPELEKRYAGLREIARQYEEALEKYQTFEAVKNSK